MSDAELELIATTLETLEEILSTHSQLIESLLDQTQSTASQEKIDNLKQRIADERLKIKKHRDAQKRKRDLEKLRASQSAPPEKKSEQNENKHGSKTIQLLDGNGKLIGWIQPVGKNLTHILNARGQLVAREVDGKTYSQDGRFMGRGYQGLRVLGMKMRG
jgi:hypothetical protein